MRKTIRVQAKFVVQSPQKVLHPGQVVFDCEKILGVQSGDAAKPDLDLGDAALLPGLVNTHTHLEFSDLTRPIQAGADFPEWIGEVIRHRIRQQENLTDRQRDEHRCRTLAAGIEELSRTGTAVAADIMSYPSRLEDYTSHIFDSERRSSDALPVTEVIALPEMIGLSADRWEATSTWAESVREKSADSNPSRTATRPTASTFSHDQTEGNRFHAKKNFSQQPVGFSPHSPYSLPWTELLRLYDSFKEPSITAMHVAESRDELEWLQTGGGAFLRSFEALGLPIPSTRTTIDETLSFLAKRRRSLVVHGNYLTEAQIEFLSAYPHVTVVYCPRTHRHFGHSKYPLDALQRQRVRFTLATDSRASNPDLSLWNEVVESRATHPGLSPSQSLAAVTTDAADALGLTGRYGVLAEGAAPWINVVRVSPTVREENLLEVLTSQQQTILPLQLNISESNPQPQ